MQVVAVLAVRNEEAYIANSLRHLIRNEVQYAIVDNASTDATVTIATSAEFRPHLVAIKQIPFNDAFDMTRLLTEKMAMITRIDADWVMHLDADEIPHSYRPGETLRQTISRIDRQGYNAVDFNEFVFLPVDFAYQPNYGAPYQPLQHYYFFEPSAPRLMRAWKKVDGFSMIEAGGHNLEGDDIRLAPETLALRHYIFRDQEHAYRKYARRIFAATDLARGWHGNRIAQPVEAFRFPKADRLSRLASPDGYDFDRSHPQLRHYWQWSGI